MVTELVFLSFVLTPLINTFDHCSVNPNGTDHPMALCYFHQASIYLKEGGGSELGETRIRGWTGLTEHCDRQRRVKTPGGSTEGVEDRGGWIVQGGR